MCRSGTFLPRRAPGPRRRGTIHIGAPRSITSATGPLHRSTRIAALSTTFLFAASATALAAPTVSGHISGAAHDTLIELASNGQTRSVVLSAKGAFALPAHSGWTLQLLAPGGRYFGPIVLAHKGTRGWDALDGHALRLGAIALHHGYAAPTHPAAVSTLKTAIWMYTSRAGAPIGAGHLGYIPRSGKATAHTALRHLDGPGSGNGNGASAALAPGGDPDHDGIPTAFDADATGSGELNSENPTASNEDAGNDFFSQMNVRIENSLNDDASGVTSSAISQSVQSNLVLAFSLGSGQIPADTSSVSADCTGLSWCAGSTVMLGAGLTQGSTWTGEVPADAMTPGRFTVNVQPNAPTSEIQPGDTFLLNEAGSAGTTTVPTMIDTYFVTEPALSSVSVDGGPATDIAYPASPTMLGTQDNPVMLSDDGVLHLNFWRPQRAGLPGETSPYMDMGHLQYGLTVGTSHGETQRSASDYGDLSSTLATNAGTNPGSMPLQDNAADSAPDPSNELGFTLNLNGCLSHLGLPTSGEGLTVQLDAEDAAGSQASQMFEVCEAGCTPGSVYGFGAGPSAGAGATPGPGAAAGTPPTGSTGTSNGTPGTPDPTAGSGTSSGTGSTATDERTGRSA